jgi:hypothetical protein
MLTAAVIPLFVSVSFIPSGSMILAKYYANGAK